MDENNLNQEKVQNEQKPKVEEKVQTANQMIGELLLGIVLYGLIGYIAYKVIYALTYTLFTQSHNYILLAIVVTVLQALMVFGIFKLANNSAFKKGTIHKSDVGKVIKNIAFVIITILVIQVLASFLSISGTVDKAVSEDYTIKFQEERLSLICTDEQMAKYNEEKNKQINKLKVDLYGYIAAQEAGIIFVYCTAIYVEKKYITEKAID